MCFDLSCHNITITYFTSYYISLLYYTVSPELNTIDDTAPTNYVEQMHCVRLQLVTHEMLLLPT